MAITSVYGGLNAKVKAMQGRLLKQADYETLSRQKTVEEVALGLREYPAYAFCLSDIDCGVMRRGIIEHHLIFSLARDFSGIYRFIDNFDLRRFFDCFFLKNEIAILKHILASIYDHRGVSYSVPELHTLIHANLKIESDRLVLSKTVPEFIENLKGTIFYDVLAAGYAENPSLFDLEMKLDIDYYLRLWHYQKKYLDGQNKRAMAQMNGAEIDLKNILWIYRLKSYYTMSDSAIYTYLIPVRYQLQKPQIIRMVEAKTPEELWAAIKESPYGGAFDTAATIEDGFCNAMDTAYQRSQMQNPDSLAPAVRYIYLKEIEIQNIISLLEGVRYGLRQEEILKHIRIRSRKGEPND